MLQSLLNSKLKRKLLKVFFSFPRRAFYVSELQEMTNAAAPSLNKILREFHDADVLRMAAKQRKKYFQINAFFNFYEELDNLVQEEKSPGEDPVSHEVLKISKARLVILSGIFSLQTHLSVDLLIVGEGLNKKKIAQIISRLQKLAGQEINYAIMDTSELRHRKNVNDRFLRDVLDNPHLVIVNNLRDKNVFK